MNVSDTTKVTDKLIELFKIDMETQKDAPQGDASLEGAEFTWKFYAGYYTADNLPSEPTKTWVTKTIAEKLNGVEMNQQTTRKERNIKKATLNMTGKKGRKK